MLVIFDWDGTLCDSLGQIVAAMQAAARECALPIPSEAAVRHIVGLGLPQAVAVLYPEHGERDREALAAAYSACYVAADPGPARLYAGALELLEALRGSGCELAIATGKTRRGLDRVLAGLGMQGYFESTRCADETASKPDPRMLSEILRERRRPREQALMVGDSIYDLDMARRLGMASVGISHGVHDHAALGAHHPVAIVDRLSELEAVVAGLAQSRTA
ncbi:HAD family hydrolase [Haliea atlantica]